MSKQTKVTGYEIEHEGDRNRAEAALLRDPAVIRVLSSEIDFDEECATFLIEWTGEDLSEETLDALCTY